MAVECSGLARNPLTVETRVRFPESLQQGIKPQKIMY